MYKTTSILLALAASSGVLLASLNFHGKAAEDPQVAVIDYGKVIWEVDHIRAYKESARGMTVAELDDKQTEQTLNTVKEIREVVDALVEEHKFSIVLRVSSFPDREKNRADFDVARLLLPEHEHNALELNRQLRVRVVAQQEVDLSQLVINKIKRSRNSTE